MGTMFSNLLKACVEIWHNIGVAQKASIVLIALVSMAAIGVVLYWGSQPDWQVLYANLDMEAASKVHDIVKDETVQMQLKDSGRTILVPSKEVYRLRLKVKSKGIDVDKSGGGWSIVDNMKLGATQKQQQITIQRAVQGELSMMVREMPGVSDARILLGTPDRQIFKKGGEVARPRATVMITMDKNKTLSATQVGSIRSLVASSVPDMRPEDITVIDNNGNSLARQVYDKDGMEGGQNEQLEAKAKYESSLKEKAEAILRPIVGDDKVVAMVSCEMEYNNIDKVIETLDTDKVIPISQKTTTSDMTKQNLGNGGKAAGAASNVKVSVANPGTESAESGGEKTATADTKKTTETQYAVPKTVTKETTRGPRLKKFSVAVTVASAKPDGSGEWTKSDTDQFKTLVEAAVGAASSAGAVEGTAGGAGEAGAVKNTVTVNAIPFLKTTAVSTDLFKPTLTDTVMTHVERVTESPIVRPILGFALLILLFRVFKSYFSRGGVEGAEFAGAGFYGAGGGGRLEGGEGGEVIATSPLEMVKIKSEKEPTAIASAMENWMASEEAK